jgi:hypothetical protein
MGIAELCQSIVLLILYPFVPDACPAELALCIDISTISSAFDFKLILPKNEGICFFLELLFEVLHSQNELVSLPIVWKAERY